MTCLTKMIQACLVTLLGSSMKVSLILVSITLTRVNTHAQDFHTTCTNKYISDEYTYTLINFRIDCEFQLQSIGDVSIECIKITIKEQSCKYIITAKLFSVCFKLDSNLMKMLISYLTLFD